MITSETNSPSREYNLTQLSLSVKLPKTNQYGQETPSSHPFTLGKTVTQLSLPVTRAVPQPHHLQHTYTNLQRQTLKPLIRIPQRPRPLNTTVGKRATKRYNITQGKINNAAKKETTATKTSKRTAHTSPTTTSPETCTPQTTPPTVPPSPPCSPETPNNPSNYTLPNALRYPSHQ